MCGRFALYDEPQRYANVLRATLGDRAARREWRPSWNVAPTQTVFGATVDDAGDVVLDTYRWGLLRSWAKDRSARPQPFNARSESVPTSRMFAPLFENRRAVVPVSGFFEWETIEGGRQPYFFERDDGETVLFAGLWDRWSDGEDEVWSCAILTTSAGPDMPIHDRQPVVLARDQWEPWLDPSSDRELLRALIGPAPAGMLVHRPVSKAVGNPRLDGPELIEPPDG